MYTDIINKKVKDVKTTKLITEGWESDVVIVNNELVFRFPKENGRFDCVYKKEKIITDFIRKRITTQISDIDIHKNFCILKLIKGENLYSTKLNHVDDFVNFLKELHSITDVKKLKNVDAENLPFYKFKLNLNDFKFDYDVLMDIFKKYNLEEDFNNCLKILSNFEYKDEENVLCHNDLHKGNVIANNGELSGIIDFGDCIFTNYNIEFVSIFKWQEKIIIDIKEKYEAITGRKLNIPFIISIIKLALYSKISYSEENKKYFKRLELFTELEKFFNGADNMNKLDILFNDELVIRKHK